jgi:uncharacterized Zn-finger protein
MGSPPRRPITRSQTSQHIPKRKRDRSNSEMDSSSSRHSTGDADSVVPVDSPQSVSAATPEIGSPSDTDTIPPPPPPPGQYTFGLGPSNQLFDRRGPRSRAALPVPVPNLTKKSRGRRVPTLPVIENDGVQKPGRLYVCKVEDCGKCFNRGEHLKRHIRSIHTHEKRTSD